MSSTDNNKASGDGVENPCKRICRYKADFYDGKVCIGCFREAFEIASWNGLNEEDKKFAVMDAADRQDEWERKHGDITGKKL
eukprot:CAMPEP_0184309166 /NCGR_PEP_ID=MMETSP1049-20130417/17415_1 /TAXON_ID=77928 /ORGANISM="Proteomonas sulcata, Strain CCMP704" /LENGTH=81 /DNA_ID=CAMNT_0026622007 /DNA_START=373 /DNA_END=618 /DNA_ORIENTATION=-